MSPISVAPLCAVWGHDRGETSLDKIDELIAGIWSFNGLTEFEGHPLEPETSDVVVVSRRRIAFRWQPSIGAMELSRKGKSAIVSQPA